MSDQELIELFKEELYRQNFSLYTIENYSKDINDFLNFIKAEKMAPSLLQVKRVRLCQNYVSYLSAHKYSSRSVNRKISSLRTFYDFLLKKGLISNNCFKEVANVKTPKKLPTFIDSDELISFIESIDTNSDLGYRNRLIIEMLFATGLRVSELCSLETKQIDFHNKQIKIFGKGKKERIVFMYDSLVDMLRYYINFTRPNLLSKSMNDEITNVFINYKGTPLTTRGVRKIINAEIDKHSLSMHISPHMLRHSFATSMLNSGLDLRSVQTLLGHENLSTTQIYTHVTEKNIRETFDKAFPRAKKD